MLRAVEAALTSSLGDPVPGSTMGHEDLHSKLDVVLEQLSLVLANGPRNQERYLTVKQAAEYAKISDKSVRRLLNRGVVRPLKPVNGKITIDREELDRYIQSSDRHPRSGRGLSRQERRPKPR